MIVANALVFGLYGLVVLVLLASVVLWTNLSSRIERHEPLVERSPRRPVPWEGMDLVWLFFAYVAMLGVMTRLAEPVANYVWPPQAVKASVESGSSTDHHVVQLLKRSRSPAIWLTCFLMVVAVAPLTEEFLFRVLIQGWLEKIELIGRARWGWRRRLPRGVLPVGFISFVFAALHARGPHDVELPETLPALLVGAALAGLATLAIGVTWTHLRVGANARDFGLAPKQFLSDIRLGLLAFLAVGPLVYAVHWTAGWVVERFGWSIAPDPAAIFVLSLALGWLYHQTHRLMPSLVLHVALNATTLAMAWLMLG